MTKPELQEWNTKYPDGSPCSMVSDDGILTVTTTKSSAWISGCVAVVLVRGCSEPYPISRLAMFDRKKLPPVKCLSCAPPLHRPDENIEEYARSKSGGIAWPPFRLRTLSDIVDAVERRKSVVCPGLFPCWHKPRPAAFIINLSGAIIYPMLNKGIYLYEKPKT